MKTRHIVIMMLALLMLSSFALLRTVVHAAAPWPNLPSAMVQITVVNGTTSYYVSTLSGVPAGFDVQDGVYPCWCVDRSVVMLRSAAHNVTLYSSLFPPSAVSGIDWVAINYILNHKQGSMMDVEQAIWHFTDAFSPISATAQEMVNDAIANPSYDPTTGDILAAICLAQNHGGVQNTIIELSELPPPPSPIIVSVSSTPNVPFSNQSVSVTAVVYGADQSILSYTTNGANWNNVSMSGAGTTFNATIPAQPSNTSVHYEVYAYNSALENWVKSDTYSYTVSTLPIIVNVSRTPNVPFSNQSVLVTAVVYGADQSILSYTTDGTNWNNVSMSGAGTTFNATIPEQPYNTHVQYEVYAYNNATQNWVKSDTYSYTVSTIPPMPLSVSISPHYAALSGGQSQLFNSTVTGGWPPYTYQWYVDEDPVSGATNPMFNYTPISVNKYHIVWLSVIDNAGTQMGSALLPSTSASVWLTTVYFTVEPVPVAPLTDVNASNYGLETPPTPSPVGQNFTVEIHLKNATLANVPNGIQGVEVHFYFGNILDYCKPIGFIDEFGQTGGALVGSVIYGVPAGFYDNWPWSGIANPPYTNATQYIVAAASTTGPFNGNDGLVAKITFQITSQPPQGQPDFYAPLQTAWADLVDGTGATLPFSITQGTLHIDATPTSPALAGDLNGNGQVSSLNLQLANAQNSHLEARALFMVIFGPAAIVAIRKFPRKTKLKIEMCQPPRAR